MQEVYNRFQKALSVMVLQAGGKYRHACIVMTEKDYARQFDLYDAVFSSFAAENSTWQVGVTWPCECVAWYAGL